MVVVLHTKVSRKPRLALFRLGKSSKQTTATQPITPEQVSSTGPANDHEDTSAQYEFPESQDSCPSPPRITARFSSRRSESRRRADSLPLDRAFDAALFSQGPNNSYASPKPVLHPLGRIHSELAATTAGHARQRSHFSIPDVIITGCEEDGNEELVEVRIAPDKRRSYVLKGQRGHSASTHRFGKRNKASSIFGRRPTPLLTFAESEPPLNDSATAVSTSSPSSKPSFATSSLSKSSAATRLRKASFPNLFGRKSLDSVSSTSLPYESVPQQAATPSSAPSQSFAIPRPAVNPASEIATVNETADSLPFSRPPVTSSFKKEQKAKLREEQALIKELERVNRLVKQHDQKTQKALDKAQAKEHKRSVKLVSLAEQAQISPLQRDAHKQPKQTVFTASTKASSSAALGRRTSVRSAGAVVRDATPGVPQPKAQIVFRTIRPVAVGGPSVASGFDNADDIKPETVTPPRPKRPSAAMSSPTTVEAEAAENVSEDFEAHVWAPSSWSSFEPAFTGHLPSLIVTSSSSSSGSSTSSHSLPLSLVSTPNDVFSDDDGVMDDETARRIRRASVQRVLALSDAGTSLLQKQTSLRKRRSQTQALQRRSSQIEASRSGGEVTDTAAQGSKRSSVVLNGYNKRIIYAQENDMDEDWVEDTPANKPVGEALRKYGETQRQERPCIPARAADRPPRPSIAPKASSPPCRPARRITTSAGTRSQSSVSSSASSSSVSTAEPFPNGSSLPPSVTILGANTNAVNIPHSHPNTNAKQDKQPYTLPPHLFEPIAST